MAIDKFTLCVKPTCALARTLPLKHQIKCLVEYIAEREVDGKLIEIKAERDAWILKGTATASFEIDDWQKDSSIKVTIVSSQGFIVNTRLYTTLPQPFEFEIDVSDVDMIENMQKVNDDLKFLDRKGQFLPLADACYTFENSTLYIAAYCKDYVQKIKSAFNLSDDEANMGGWVRDIDIDRNTLKVLSPLSFSQIALGIDGSFRFTLPYSENKEPQGWLWILVASQIFVGMQVEETINNPRERIGLLLPFNFGNAKPNDPGEGKQLRVNTKPSTSGIVGDASERDLLYRPNYFSDEPGTYLDPFRNTFRIFGENTFYTILRVDAPDIGGTPSLIPLPPSIWNFRQFPLATNTSEPAPILRGKSPDVKKLKKDTVRSSIEQPASVDTKYNFPPSLDEVPAVVTDQAASGEADTIEIAIRKLTRLNADDVIKNQEAWVIKNSGGRKDLNSRNPIQWEGDSNIYQATTIGRGHILEHRVRWRSNGYSLGNILHSLTLAPRQTKRITTISWSRSEEAKRQEITSAQDLVQNETQRERDYFDVVQSSLREWSTGESRSSTKSGAGGLGFAGSGFVIGGGCAQGSSKTTAMQEGARDVAAKEHQSLRDSIRQYGESLRQFQSMVINEVSQEETVTGVSEIVRNSNYSHSLTVIYHEILRHIRVDTEVVGARECLFVPFSMRPFTLERIIKHRDSLGKNLIKKELRWVISHLDDLRNNFVNSTIPEGPRYNHPLRHLTGSLFVQLAIARPKDGQNDEFVDDNWKVLFGVLGEPARAIYERLVAQDKVQREVKFQKEIAPIIAARWANSLSLGYVHNLGTSTKTIAGTSKPKFAEFMSIKFSELTASKWTDMLDALSEKSHVAPVTTWLSNTDFTLATRYSYNGIVRIDFSCHTQGSSLTRKKLEDLILKATQDLPPGSIANLKQVKIHYFTDTFDRNIESVSSTNDLIDAENGLHDSNGAVVDFPLSSWEQIDLREVIRQTAGDLLLHLNEHVEYYHKVIWWNMDRDKLYMLLDGFYVPGDSKFSVASVVERNPVAILGNTLVFRVAPGAFLGIAEQESPDELNDFYRPKTPSEPMRISIPTGGVYAQALMDKSMATEEHYGSTDWVLSDREPELETIGTEGLMSRRAEPASTTPTPFQAPIINLQAAPEAPAVSGFDSILRAITSGESFRDVAQVAGTQAAATAAMQTAASLASDFGSKAVELQRSQQATANAPQKLASIQKARDAHLVDDDQAKSLATKTLDEMNTQPSEGELIKNDAVRKVVEDASSRPGTPIEVKRGLESVSVGAIPASAEVNMPVSTPTPINDVDFVLKKVGAEKLSKHEHELLHKFLSITSTTAKGIDALVVAAESFIELTHWICLTGEALGVVGFSIMSIEALLKIISMFDEYKRFFALRACAYSITSWAFNQSRPDISQQCLGYLKSSKYITDAQESELTQAWNDAVDSTYKNLQGSVQSSGVPKEIWQEKIKLIGFDKNTNQCEPSMLTLTILIDMEKMFDEGVWRNVWKALTNRVAYPN